MDLLEIFGAFLGLPDLKRRLYFLLYIYLKSLTHCTWPVALNCKINNNFILKINIGILWNFFVLRSSTRFLSFKCNGILYIYPRSTHSLTCSFTHSSVRRKLLYPNWSFRNNLYKWIISLMTGILFDLS